MNTYILNLLIISLLLLFVSIGSSWIARLPVSYALIYLFVGILLGPNGLKLFQLRPDAEVLERLCEFVVIVSVYSCGLKMSRPLTFRNWNTTIRLIAFLMPISILAIAFVGRGILGLDWGVAILLGAILAPTDPVLASDVQMTHSEDKDDLRFALTSEGGLNDAFAFPFVYFGIFLIKDSNWKNWIHEWVAVDLVWAIAAGIIMGIIVAKAIVWLDRRRNSGQNVMENFFALSILLMTYTLTELVNGYGFVAVFVAGIVIQRAYKEYDEPEKYHAQLEFIEQIEKIVEIAAILLLGSILLLKPIIAHLPQGLIVAGLLILFIRPMGTFISLFGSRLPIDSRLLLGWFGIRGLGSLYYLTYAFGKGLDSVVVEQIAWITFITIVISMILHGISATPLMNWYETNLSHYWPKFRR